MEFDFELEGSRYIEDKEEERKLPGVGMRLEPEDKEEEEDIFDFEAVGREMLSPTPGVTPPTTPIPPKPSMGASRDISPEPLGLVERGVQKAGKVVGLDLPLRPLPEEERAKKTFQTQAEERGITPEELAFERIRGRPPTKFEQVGEEISKSVQEVVGYGVAGAVESFGLGFPSKIYRGITGKELPEPTTAAGKIAFGLGHLAGFIKGPAGKVVHKVGEGVGKVLPKVTAETISMKRIPIAAAKESIALGLGIPAVNLGDVLNSSSMSEAGRKLYEHSKSGAVMGGIFGMTRGVLPSASVKSRLGRITMGVTLLDTMHGTHPLDVRDLSDKVFDYGMDVVFLWQGLPSKLRTEKTLDKITKRMDEAKSYDEFSDKVISDLAKELEVKVRVEAKGEDVGGTSAKELADELGVGVRDSDIAIKEREWVPFKSAEETAEVFEIAKRREGELRQSELGRRLLRRQLEEREKRGIREEEEVRRTTEERARVSELRKPGIEIEGVPERVEDRIIRPEEPVDRLERAAMKAPPEPTIREVSVPSKPPIKVPPPSPAEISAGVFKKEFTEIERLLKSPEGREKLREKLEIEEANAAVPPAERSMQVFEKEFKWMERVIKSPGGRKKLREELWRAEGGKGKAPKPVIHKREEPEILSVQPDPINVRGKVSEGNWAVEYDVTSILGGTGKQTNTKYFWRKKEAQEWIKEQEGVLAAPPKTERRKDTLTREHVQRMIKEGKGKEVEDIIFTDSLTGLKNRRGWEAGTRKKYQGMVDADGLKFLNDNVSYAAGDSMLKLIGKALGKTTDLASREKGDEFRYEADTLKEVMRIEKEVDAFLDKNPIKVVMPDGEIRYYKGKVSHGRGNTEKAAEERLHAAKKKRVVKRGEEIERVGEPETKPKPSVRPVRPVVEGELRPRGEGVPGEKVPREGEGVAGFIAATQEQTTKAKTLVEKSGFKFVGTMEGKDSPIVLLNDPKTTHGSTISIPLSRLTKKTLVIEAQKKIEEYREKEESKEVVRAKRRIKTTVQKTLQDEKGEWTHDTIRNTPLIQDLIVVGKDVIQKGHVKFKDFQTQMKGVLGSVWDEVKGFIREVYTSSRAVLKSQKGVVEIGPHKPRPETTERLAAEYQKEMEKLLKWKKVPPKTQIRKTTGQVKYSDVIREDVALKAGLKKAEQAAKKAEREGRTTEHARMREQLQQMKEKKKEADHMRELGKRISKPIPSTVDLAYREMIEVLQEGIDPKVRTKKVLDRRERMRQYLESHPKEVETIPTKLLKELGEKSLSELDVGHLEDIAIRIDALTKLGKLKYRLKKREETRILNQIDEEMYEGIRGVPGKKPVGPKGAQYPKRKAGKLYQGFRAYTLGVPRICDKFDGGKNFRGPVHNFFYDTTNRIESEKIAAQDKRYDRGNLKLKELGITMSDLTKTRKVGDFQFTLDAMIDVYVGMKNPRKRLALNWGNEISDSLATKIENRLTPKEKKLGDWIIDEYSRHYSRYREAYADRTNKDMGWEESYTPIHREEVEYKTLEDQIHAELTMRKQFKRGYPERGATHKRKDIKKEFQKPIRLGAYGTWLSSVARQEHYIHNAQHTSRMHKILNSGKFRTELLERFDKEWYDQFRKYVDRVANPYVYWSFDGAERASSFLRRNSVLAYLSYNLLTVSKQAPSLALFLKDAGVVHLTAAAGQAATGIGAVKLIREVNSMEPQLKHRSIEREMEELKQASRESYDKILTKVGKTGMKGIYLMDKLVVSIGYKAVYEKGLANDLSVKEAKKQALNVVLRTQPAASPKDIPGLYATSEYLNWFLQFTNQLNKIYNIATYDVPADVREGRYMDAIMGTTGLAIAALGIWAAITKEVPDAITDVPKYIWDAISTQALNIIPVFGRHIAASKDGWKSSSIPAFEGAEAVGVVLQKQKELKKPLSLEKDQIRNKKFWLRKAGAVGEAAAVIKGLPVVGTKRAYKTIKGKEPWEIIGGRGRDRYGKKDDDAATTIREAYKGIQ